jgi:hypothetical protein
MTEYQPTPQTPEQVADGLRNAMKQAKEDGVFAINKVKFVYVTRTIDPKTRIHYLDAVDENGYHWSAQQETGVEPWITYKETWKKDPQQPLDL